MQGRIEVQSRLTFISQNISKIKQKALEDTPKATDKKIEALQKSDKI